jgi:hypothetical protein
MTRRQKSGGAKSFLLVGDAQFLAKPRKPIPHGFVLDALMAARPVTRPMFGCLAVYVEDKIVMALRDKEKNTDDNGVWLATTPEHHESLRGEFPNMRSIRLLGKNVTGWQILPADAPDFQEAALRVCELIVARDRRIGKVPGTRRPKSDSKDAAKPTRRPKPAKRLAKRGSKR